MISTKIYEMRWKSSEDRKPAWNRAKVFFRCSKSNLTVLEPYDTRSKKVNTKHENLWKSLKSIKSIKITKIRWKSSELGQEASLESSKGFSDPASQLASRAASQPTIHENPWTSMKIHEIRWKSSEGKKPAWIEQRAAGRTLPSWNIMTPDPRKAWKSMKIV